MTSDEIKPGQREQAEPWDWDKPAIVAALWRAGWSLRQLSIKNNYAPGTLSAALNRPFPRGEAIVAAVLGVSPTVIWPTRYAERARRRKNRRGK